MRALALPIAAAPAALLAQSAPVAGAVRATGNPILSDGRYYSTDPAPLVDGDTLRILAGRDAAPAGVNYLYAPVLERDSDATGRPCTPTLYHACDE